MAKKKKTSIGNLVLSIITMVVGALTCLALFLNVWNLSNSKAGATEVGGYFADMSGIETTFKVADVAFMSWASTVAGIAVIVALCAAGLYILCTILNLATKGSKLMNALARLACIIMLAAGAVALVCSIIFIIPKVEGLVSTTRMAFGVGAYFGFICPIVAGLIGLANK